MVFAKLPGVWEIFEIRYRRLSKLLTQASYLGFIRKFLFETIRAGFAPFKSAKVDCTES